MKPFEIEVQHSADTVSDLTRAQYAVSHKAARLVQVVTAVVCLLVGLRIIGGVAEPFNYFFSLYGCLAIVFINVPAKSTANRVVEQIQKSGKPFPCSVFVFGEKDFNVRPKGDHGKGETVAYAKCFRLLRYRRATYFFLNEQAAFIFPDSCIKGQSPAEFQAFLSTRTGKPCQTLYPWLSASLWSVIKQKKAS